MKTIPLTQGKVAIVDDEDFDWLNQWKWRAIKHCNAYYAMRNTGKRPNRGHIYMHRQILGLTRGDGKITDHINHYKLDNCRTNLRLVTNSQNAQNRISRRGSSQYKGIRWNKNRWMARITLNNKVIYLGLFTNEIKATKAYDQKAKELFGEFANCNFV